MGLFDAFVNELLSSGGTQGQQPQQPQQEHEGLMHVVLEMLHSPQGGALIGLVKTFEQNGLTHLIASWVSTGPNLPATPQQIQQGLGADKIQQISQQTGMQPQAVSSALAQLLPLLVDKLTPSGQVPKGDLLQHVLGMLGKQ